jgi:serpin B
MISPLSVSLALAMTYNGANGETKADMEKTLALNGLSREQINLSYQALMAALQSADPDVILEMANAIYYRKEFKVMEDFKTVNKDFYKAAVAPLDFNSPDALKTINGWVSEKTHDKIPTIIDQIDPMLVMVLLNAVYFNGLWKSKFGEKNTHMLPFRLGDGSMKDVAQMNQETALEYTSNELFSAVNLPYGKGQDMMTVILPNSGKSTSQVVSVMNNNNWNQWMKSFKTENIVVVTMPRFKFSWKIKLNDILSAMGMTKAFTPNVADFSGISKDHDLYISFVIHKTFVDVNENGTEAAAVTAVGISITSIPGDIPKKVYFTVDRPFLFAISEKTTGAILFIGEVKSPEYQ